MELPNVLRSLEEVTREIAAYDKDIQDIAELALLRMTNMWGNPEMLKEFRNVVKLRRDAMLRRDALVRLGTAACSSGTLARDAEAERQAKEEAEQKAKEEAEQKAKAEAEDTCNEEGEENQRKKSKKTHARMGISSSSSRRRLV